MRSLSRGVVGLLRAGGRAAAVVTGALAFDHLLGEPSPRWHPVVWIGSALDRWRDLAGDDAAGSGGLVRGGAGLAAVTGAGMLAATGVRRVTRGMPAWVGTTAEAGVLSVLLSRRMLIDEALDVERALDRDVEHGRAAVARLVSREVDELDAVGVRASAVESLAENASDAVVATLLWWAVGGLPAAVAHRVVNTADAMWGYRTADLERFGKVAARTDDLANWVPARVTGLLLAPEIPAGRIADQARHTPSPNAGWPMGAIALALGRRLAKPGVYTLHPHGFDPRRGDIAATVRRVNRAVAVVAGAVLARALVQGRGDDT